MSYRKLDAKFSKYVYFCIGWHTKLNKLTIVFGLCDYNKFTSEHYDRMTILAEISKKYKDFNAYCDLLVMKNMEFYSEREMKEQLESFTSKCVGRSLIQCDDNMFYVPNTSIYGVFSDLFHELLVNLNLQQKSINSYMKTLFVRLY